MGSAEDAAPFGELVITGECPLVGQRVLRMGILIHALGCRFPWFGNGNLYPKSDGGYRGFHKQDVSFEKYKKVSDWKLLLFVLRL